MHLLIDVPAGLNGVAVADTSIGDVDGDAGFYHYRGVDATWLARTVGVEDVWHLLAVGELPDAAEREAFRSAVAADRNVPDALLPVIEAVARSASSPLAQLRAVVSVADAPLGLHPLLDLGATERETEARRLAAAVPAVLGALHGVRRVGNPSPPIRRSVTPLPTCTP